MDEAVVAAALEMDYDEDCKLGNIKLTLMVMACLFALLAHFYPTPFPDSRALLAVCCVSYFTCSAALQAIITFVEKDTIMITQPRGKAERGLRIRTRFPRFESNFTLIVQGAEPGGEKRQIEKVFSVGEFFDFNGYFWEEGLRERCRSAIKEWETKQGSKKTK
ncbi:unnamed protein product [Chrysoparadoxa australica]